MKVRPPTCRKMSANSFRRFFRLASVEDSMRVRVTVPAAPPAPPGAATFAARSDADCTPCWEDVDDCAQTRLTVTKAHKCDELDHRLQPFPPCAPPAPAPPVPCSLVTPPGALRKGARAPRPARSVSFDEVTRTAEIPCLCDIDDSALESMFWSPVDYADIRTRQRDLILAVLRQASDYPQGTIPPAIAGESRRGLGICCEPGTMTGRASRVATGRTLIVDAFNAGYSWEMLAHLSEQLTHWAAVNAHQVGLKDQDQEELSHVDFARTFFLSGSCAECAAPPHAFDDALATTLPELENRSLDAAAPSGGIFSAGQAPPPGARKPRASVARAAARTAARSQRQRAAPGSRPASPGGAALAPALAQCGQDGLGLASMVRIDSFSHLPAGEIRSRCGPSELSCGQN
ncbi:hypothetical protein M885DRAFT_521745 [Pelagophyceae sp. CCMP2097]|nr:hypothetical protein M885DRAFT_521745 [Pelagophyceae sp. CCMP2097]